MRVILMIAMVIMASTLEFKEQDSYFKRLVSAEYGQTLMKTIYLEMGQDNAVERIQTLLKSMLDDLLADQVQAGSAIKEREATCSEKIIEIDAYTERVELTKADQEQQLPLKLEQLQDKQAQLVEKREEIDRNKDKIQSLQSDRDEEHQAFSDRRDEMTQLVNALKEAKGIIQQLNGGSFLQVPQTILTQIKAHGDKISIDSLIFHPPQRSSSQRNMPSNHSHPYCWNQRPTKMSTQTPIRCKSSWISSTSWWRASTTYRSRKCSPMMRDRRTSSRMCTSIIFMHDNSEASLSENSRLEQANVHDSAAADHLNTRYKDLVSNIATQATILDSKAIERQDWTTSGEDERNSYNQSEALRYQNFKQNQGGTNSNSVNSFNDVFIELKQLMQ